MAHAHETSETSRRQLLAYQAARQNEDAFDGGQGGAIALTEALIAKARQDGVFGQVMLPVGVAQELVRKAQAA
jgi:hypothetical protein